VLSQAIVAKMQRPQNVSGIQRYNSGGLSGAKLIPLLNVFKLEAL
jgi:hypothetical protein